MENFPTGKLAPLPPRKVAPYPNPNSNLYPNLNPEGDLLGAVSRRTILRSRSTLRMPPKNKIFMFNFPSLILK